MKADKNNCCNDPTLVEIRQRSQNDMTATICFHCRRFVETNDKATSLQSFTAQTP